MEPFSLMEKGSCLKMHRDWRAFDAERGRIMSIIDSSNAKEHSYPVYGRQFKSYRWYKPIITAVLFFGIYIGLSLLLFAGVMFAIRNEVTPDSLQSVLESIFATDYDSMDLANAWQSVVSLGGVAVMIPALWLASVIVRDRPFSSYSSSRGGWSSKVFWRAFPVAFVCIALPILVDELFVQHHIDNFQMRFTIASFAVVTVLGPLQCIAEEYIFRGLLMQTLGSWLRVPVIAVILQSVVFVLMHPYDMIGKIGIFVTGTVFAVTAWLGRGIEISSAFHICNNMTIFYLQGLNIAEISSTSDMRSLIFEIVTGVAYILIIFIISKRTNWFSKIRKNDLAAWNKKIDEKAARKEAKKAAKAEKKAAKNEPIGEHEESAPGKHFKQ